MVNTLRFIIPGIPKPKQSSRQAAVYRKGHPVTYYKGGVERVLMQNYQDPEVKQEAENIRAIVLQQLPADFIPFTKGIRIKKLCFCFPVLKGLAKSDQIAVLNNETVYKTTKPDLQDNLMKGVFDALQGIVYINDSQICEILYIVKKYDIRPHTEIILEEI